jgi:phospholipid/cholesterol/gamma-HCH transport system permease protein
MPAVPDLPVSPAELARGAQRAVAGWWGIVRLGVLLLEAALTPSAYGRDNRHALARHIVSDAAPVLAGFTVLTTLVSLIVIRIVIVTALSYGLTQYALEMVVRVLVLELIPLTAALFAALRCTIPNAVEVALLRVQHGRQGPALLRHEVLPRVASGVFSALLLAAVSCVVTLVLAYLSVYGLVSSGLEAYTRTVGQIFNPAVSLVFGLKILFLGLAVALVPMAAALDDTPAPGRTTSAEVQGLVRMFLVILLIEAASLVGNYY